VPGLPQIVAFRTQLIHGDARVKHGTVWNVVQDSLPPLLDCVQVLLQELGEISSEGASASNWRARCQIPQGY